MSIEPLKHPLDEALSQAFQDPAPADLRAALLGQARRADRWRHRVRNSWMMAAAAFLLLFGLGAFSRVQTQRQVSRLAKAALNEFIQARPMDFQGQPQVPLQGAPDGCCAWSKARLGFMAPLPDQAAGCPMKGGRACRIEGRPAACYVLEDGRCMLVLERPIPGSGEVPGPVLASLSGFQVRAWNEKGRGFFLIEPSDKPII